MEYNTDRLITAATAIVLSLVIFAGGKIVFSNGIDNISTLGNKLITTIDNSIKDMNVKDMNVKEDTKTPFVFSYNNNDNTATVVSFKDPKVKKDGWTDEDIENVVIPVKIRHNGQLYKVTEIGEGAFSTSYSKSSRSYLSHIKTLTIENGIQKIDKRAFMNNDIPEVNIPSSVTEIGEGAFRYSGVQTLKLNPGLKIIGKDAFVGAKTQEVNIPSSVTEIGDSAFRYSIIQTLKLNSGLKTIGDGAFFFDFNSDGDGITELTIPNTVTTIGDQAFQNNKIESLSLPEGLKTIGRFAFRDHNLKNLTLPKSVTTIGPSAFENASHMDTLTLLPVDITSDGKQGYAPTVFQGITVNTLTINASSIGRLGTDSINKLIIGDTTKKIEYGAFAYQRINEINISNSVQFFSGASFCGNNFKTVTISKTAQIQDKTAFVGVKVKKK